MVALKNMRYAGQPYTKGMTFEARDVSDATVLRMAKLAADAPPSAVEPVHPDAPESTPVSPSVFTDPSSEEAPIEPEPEEFPAVSDAEDVKDLEPETVPVPRRRTYRRKDLTAEGQ
jgi:hypothetical protein